MKHLYTFLLLASFQAAVAQIEIEAPVAVCAPGDCTSLMASFTPVQATTSYAVASIPYQPLYPFTGGAVISVSGDDMYSPLISLPFTFSFYGTAYDGLVIGTNGVITFNAADAGQQCPWPYQTALPDAGFPIKNAIFGSFQDTNISTPPVVDPAVQNVNYYLGGTAPYRYFVANFNELPFYACNNSVGLQTSQIIIFETTNVVEVYIKNRTPCTTWNGGRGLVGLLDATGTQAVVPEGRNTGAWSASNEAWRFSPTGASQSQLIWVVGGEVASQDNPFVFCPQTDSAVTAILTHTLANGETLVQAADILVPIAQFEVEAPEDLYACSDTGVATFDLTTVLDELLASLESPENYGVTFHENETDAVNGANPFGNPDVYTTSGQTLYVRVENLVGTGCAAVTSFTLHVAVSWPQGEPVQTFQPGATIADIVFDGPDLEWYATPDSEEELDPSTPLVNGATYYAETDEGIGCGGEGDRSGGRFPVTVYDATMGLPVSSAASVAVSPNPTRSMVTVQSSVSLNRIELFNLLGQRVLEAPAAGRETPVDLSGLPAGTYLLKASGNDGAATAKVVRQ